MIERDRSAPRGGASHQKRSLIEAGADELTRRQPQQGLGGTHPVGIPGMSVELAGDLPAIRRLAGAPARPRGGAGDLRW
ncbi:hypothetical protein [Candidatus Solirubrobacter pratensis]|uniref:hypothetical protein n=1 Tax=Candidatus Solirubrobacter pratensis TaxID=1298857 RepID=UPI0003F8B407|nr:hypothetical protein [Candidatus Solirubrobacter pratensis]